MPTVVDQTASGSNGVSSPSQVPTASATSATLDPSMPSPSTSRVTIKNIFTPDAARGAKGSSVLERKASAKMMLRTKAVNEIGRSPTLPGRPMSSVNTGQWSVSVAEAGEERKPRKKGKMASIATPRSYTLYVNTPTHNLTLQRTVEEIVTLDLRLREAGNTGLPPLPKLVPSLATASVPTSPPPPLQGGSRRLFQTISRTLSPSGTRKRTNLKQITKSLGSAASTASSPSTAEPSTPSAHMGDTLSKQDSPPSTSEGPAADGKATTALVAYFTTLSSLSSIKAAKAWQNFIRVRTDDLQSQRVERRVHRVRSDLASHSKSAVAPTNTNVGGEGGRRADESQSDIGEDGNGRITEDERENLSISGRSGSRQSWSTTGQANAAALVPSHSGRSSTGEEESVTMVGGKKGSPHFAKIPEESEKEKEVAAPSQLKHNDVTVESSQIGMSADSSLAESSNAGNDGEPTAATATAGGKSAAKKRRSDRSRSEKVTVDDFDMIRVLGKGCAGKVLLVRHKPTSGLFAMKSIHKRHVLAHQELQHTLTEQAVLKRMAREALDPFCVKLWWSFHDKQNLYLVMDFHPGGDLATQLSRWGRLGRDRARFYAAEIVEGVEGLHKAGVIYRDLKPENVLIAADGHIVLSDFGLSKEFNDRREDGLRERSCTTPPPSSPPRFNSSRDVTTATALGTTTSSSTSTGSPKVRRPPWMSASEEGTSSAKASNREERDTTTTFCGTAEYLAPEVIQGVAYSYEVDWWSFGTMLYEFLVGVTPFWADTHAEMYIRVLHDELVFPEDRVLDADTKGFLRGLLQRNPMLRMKEPRIKKHPYFSMIEWDHVYHKRYIPPYVPPINPLDETDTQNFDEAFLDMQPVVQDEGDDADAEDGEAIKDQEDEADAATQVGHNDEETPQDGKVETVPDDAGKTGSTAMTTNDTLVKTLTADGQSLFDGYSFRGRKDSDSMHSSFRSESMGSDLTSELMALEKGTVAAQQVATSNAALDRLSPGVLSPTPTPIVPTLQQEQAAERYTAATPLAQLMTDPVPSSGTVRPPSVYSPVSVAAEVLPAVSFSPPSSPSPTSSPAPHLFQPVPQRPRREELVLGKHDTAEVSEDEDSAARAAVFALDMLEREANQEELNGDSHVDSSSSTPPTSRSSGGAGGVHDARHPSSATAGIRGDSSSGQQVNLGDADDEADGEDEEWDLVDSALPSSTDGRRLPSDVNGGKGQNLFARGVVDTYRMLRRQDSARPNAGTGPGPAVPPRPFSRLAARRKGSSQAGVSGIISKSSRADIRAGSILSLDSAGNVAGSVRGSLTAQKDNNNVESSGSSNRLPANLSSEIETLEELQQTVRSSMSIAPGAQISRSPSEGPGARISGEVGKTTATPAVAIEVDHSRASGVGDGSVEGSSVLGPLSSITMATSISAGGAPPHGNEVANGNGDGKRQSRIRRRFTTFFEQAAR